MTLLRTNACSPLATNAVSGNIWDNFSSSTYKELPSVGAITVQDPFTGERRPFVMPGGGRGYTRVPSLVSMWSTAPFLLNKQLGSFSGDPSVESRMKSFQASIEQLLWPETRRTEPGLDGFVMRATERSWISIPMRQIPPQLASFVGDLTDPLSGLLKDSVERLFDKDGNFQLGPIPKGFPINLAANYQPLVDIEDPAAKAEHAKNVAALLEMVTGNFPPDLSATDQEMLDWLKKLRGPLLKLFKCPYFVVNKGHYFGTAKFNDTEGLSEDEKLFVKEPEPVLSDDDKRALIEFLKTF